MQLNHPGFRAHLKTNDCCPYKKRRTRDTERRPNENNSTDLNVVSASQGTPRTANRHGTESPSEPSEEPTLPTS